MKPETRTFYERAVECAVETVVRSLDDALDLQMLARGAGLSPFHFHRVFRGLVGETPLELHRRLRMERAAWSLQRENTSITAIAFAAGYETHEAFTRAFRRHYACSPSELRRSVLLEGTVRPWPFQVELAARSGIHFEPHRAAPLAVRFIQGGEDMDVRITKMPPMRVATMRHVGPYNRISEAFGRLGELASRAELFGPQSAMLALYHDDPETTPPAELRSDAALTVSPDVKLPSGVEERHIPGGRYACTTHVGSYTQLGDTWARFMGEWLARSGERMGDGVSYEIYRNAPGEVPEEALRTDLYIPLAG